MRYIISFLLLVLSNGGLATSIASPKTVLFNEADKYGIEVSRNIGDEQSVVFLKINEVILCPIDKVLLVERFMAVGERKRYLKKYDERYTSVFNNTQEYESINFVISCKEYSKSFGSTQFRFVLF